MTSDDSVFGPELMIMTIKCTRKHVWRKCPIYLIEGLQNQIHLNILSYFIDLFFGALDSYLVSNKTQKSIKIPIPH